MEPHIPDDDAFRIQLPVFEGPLDLLLHLIQKHELDILDLPIAFVTERYLEYLQVMRELNLDIASEYLVMAATLAHVKSKMLLPTPPSDQEDEEETGEYIDPREELIRRLLEYQKYKAVAADLGSRPIAGRDVFGRGTPAPQAQGPAPLAEVSLFKLLDAFQAVLRRNRDKVAFEVTSEQITIQERIGQITDHLRARRECTFEQLFEDTVTRYQMVVTLLALLEMAKRSMIRVYQADPVAPIHVQYALLEDGDAADAGAAAGTNWDAEVTSDAGAQADANGDAEVTSDAGAQADANGGEEPADPLSESDAGDDTLPRTPEAPAPQAPTNEEPFVHEHEDAPQDAEDDVER